MFGRRGFGRRRGQSGLPMLLLAAQLLQVGFDRIPPVTLITLLGQVAIFINPFGMRLPRLYDVCISGVNVWYKEQWQRLLFAAFFHVDEWHLYYNMVSFLWKGINVEKKLGASYFAYMIAVFAALCNVTTVGLALLAENATGDPSYITQCAAGFSGVLFALKVVTTHMMPPGRQSVMGLFSVNSRIACWVELLLIKILVPNSSFLGHLAGILVGLLYVKGPLKLLMDQLHTPGPSYTYVRSSTSGSSYNPRYNFSGTAGGGNRQQDQYTAGLTEEEQMRRATDESLHSANQRRRDPSAPSFADSGFSDTSSSQTSNSNNLYPDLNDLSRQQTQRSQNTSDLDDVRRRRLARFDT